MKYLSQLCYKWKRAKGYKKEVGFVWFTQTGKMVTLVDCDKIYKYRYRWYRYTHNILPREGTKTSIQRYILKDYRLMKINSEIFK